jgi:hypothetical protein
MLLVRGRGDGVAGFVSGTTSTLSTLTKIGAFLAKGTLLASAARGAVSSALTQGVGTIAGLQAKFSFAGVAAGAIGHGVTGGLSLGGSGIAGRLGAGVSGLAGDIAGAAARSLIEGSDFGDNIIAGLPGAIGATIGQIIADGVQRSGRSGGRALTRSQAAAAQAALAQGTAADGEAGISIITSAGFAEARARFVQQVTAGALWAETRDTQEARAVAQAATSALAGDTGAEDGEIVVRASRNRSAAIRAKEAVAHVTLNGWGTAFVDSASRFSWQKVDRANDGIGYNFRSLDGGSGRFTLRTGYDLDEKLVWAYISDAQGNERRFWPNENGKQVIKDFNLEVSIGPKIIPDAQIRAEINAAGYDFGALLVNPTGYAGGIGDYARYLNPDFQLSVRSNVTSLSSSEPAGYGDAFRYRYREAVNERTNGFADITNGHYVRGGFAVIGSGLDLLMSPITGSVDLAGSLLRRGSFTPDETDRRRTNETGKIVGIASLAFGNVKGVASFRIVAAESAGVDLALKYKSGWSAAQRTDALTKAQMLTEADTVVLQTARGSTSAASRYRSSGGTVPSGSDVDHIIDLQLGGADTVRNMLPLNSSVNRSLGAQIQHQIKNLPPGTRINRVTIGDR